MTFVLGLLKLYVLIQLNRSKLSVVIANTISTSKQINYKPAVPVRKHSSQMNLTTSVTIVEAAMWNPHWCNVHNTAYHGKICPACEAEEILAEESNIDEDEIYFGLSDDETG